MNPITSIRSRFNSIRGLQLFQLLRFGGIFLTGVVLSKTNVSMATIGTYESLIFLASAVSFFWVSGFMNGMLAGYHDQPEHKRGEHFYNATILLCFSAIVISIVLFTGRSLLEPILKTDNPNIYPLLVTYVLLNTPSFINEYILLLKDRRTSLFGYGLFLFATNLLAVALPLSFGYPMEIALQLLILVSTLKLLYTGYLLQCYARFHFDQASVLEQIRISTPLIISLLISGSADYIDGFLVNHYFGSESFALFRYGARELPPALLLANAMSTAMVPRIAASPAAGMQELKSESLKLMRILFPLTILLMLLSKWLYPLVFRHDFEGSAVFFNIYLLLLVSRMVFPQSIVIALRDTGVIFRIALAEIAVNIVASYTLMLYFGIAGVAWGTVVAYATEKILLCIHLKRKHHLSVSTYIPVKQLITLSALLVFTYLLVHNFA